MITTELLNEIEQTCNQRGAEPPDRGILLKWMSADVNYLSGECRADWFHMFLNPMIRTTSGTREYDLPENFPANFVPWAGSIADDLSGDGNELFCCKLSDGTNERIMTFESPVRFYSRNLTAESNGLPNVYTIASRPTGRRFLLTSPPPDANGSVGYYSIGGLYEPTDWKIKEEQALPPIPGNLRILKAALLKRIFPGDQSVVTDYQEAYAAMMLSAAQSKSVRMYPKNLDVRRLR